MIIEVHPHFKKSYKSRIKHNKELIQKFNERLEIFRQNASAPILKDHPLLGDMKGFRSFSITGDIRVVYFKIEDTIWLYDIGTHNQVYQK